MFVKLIFNFIGLICFLMYGSYFLGYPQQYIATVLENFRYPYQAKHFSSKSTLCMVLRKSVTKSLAIEKISSQLAMGYYSGFRAIGSASLWLNIFYESGKDWASHL